MGEMLLNGRLYGASGIRELTQAQYDALPASKLTDGILYCIKDTGIVEGEKFAPVIYSLEEREIGVWTDGKPLYQKTIDFGYLPNNTYKDLAHNIANVDKIWVYDGYLNRNNVFEQLNKPAGDGLQYQIETYVSTQYVTIRDWTNFSDFTAIITVQYTKTTDIPGSGTWGTDGVPMVHYDGNEKVIGTWFGETLYEKTYIFDTTISLNSNTWTNTSYDGSFIGGIIDCKGYAENMIPNAALLASKSSNDLIQLLNLRTSPINCKGFTIQYTKTS